MLRSARDQKLLASSEPVRRPKRPEEWRLVVDTQKNMFIHPLRRSNYTNRYSIARGPYYTPQLRARPAFSGTQVPSMMSLLTWRPDAVS